MVGVQGYRLFIVNINRLIGSLQIPFVSSQMCAIFCDNIIRADTYQLSLLLSLSSISFSSSMRTLVGFSPYHMFSGHRGCLLPCFVLPVWSKFGLVQEFLFAN